MNFTRLSERLPSYLSPFFTLQYLTDTPAKLDSFYDSHYYNTGPRDVCLVITCILVMAILRDGARLGIMEPFARWKLSRDLRQRREAKLYTNGLVNSNFNGGCSPNGNGHAVHTNGNGVQSSNGNGHAVYANGNGNGSSTSYATTKELRKMQRSVLRFAEQGWSVIYYTVQWGFGLYVHRNLPTAVLNPTDLWLNYPHIPLAGPLKFYYLTQTAFYIHQVLILNAEARRKDHVQMMAHHVITILLMLTSYYSNFTRVGCLIMVLMDYCDIFLPLAKMLRYVSMRKLCDATFTWFLISWFVTRHILFLFVIKSTYTDLPRLVPFEWAPEQGRYLSKSAWVIFCSLLSALQVLQCIWFWMICRVAYRVITGQGAEDNRSDDEDSDHDNAQTKKKNQ